MAGQRNRDALAQLGEACPSQQALLDSLEGRRPQSDQATVLDHLDQCTACRDRLQGLAASDALWSEAASQLRDATTDDDQGLRHVMALLSTQVVWAEETPPPFRPGLPMDFLAPCPTPDRLGCLGPYEIVEVLGRGGMGVVLKAVDPALDRVVAIKVLNSSLALSPEARARFRREARSAASVRSEHVVTIHAVEEKAEPPYLVMEYVAGGSLQQRIDQAHPMPLDEIIRIGAEIARGLAAAHARGLIHRDIKPANILLEEGTGKVKISDFGLARAVDDAGLTGAGTLAGTPEYMAPEQADAGPVDHRADLFSLGSVLYAMCTGRPPFRAQGSLAVLRRTREDTPAPISQFRPDVPQPLIEIVENLHRKNPTERYASAAKVADALEQLRLTSAELPGSVSGERPGAERLPSPVSGEGPGVRGKRRVALAAGGAGAIVLLGVVLTLSTGKGTVQLEFSDAEAARQCTISIDGDEIRLENLGEPIKLRPGKHELRVTHGDLEIETREFTVVRGGNRVVAVSLPSPAAGPESRKAELSQLAQVHANRAHALIEQGDFDGAVIEYSDAIRFAPTVAEYYLARGDAHWCSGRTTAVQVALRDYGEAIRLAPGSAAPWASRGMGYHRTNQPNKAESDLKEALRISRDCLRRALQTAEDLRQMGHEQRAALQHAKAEALLWALTVVHKGQMENVLVEFREIERLGTPVGPGWRHWASSWLPFAVRGAGKIPGIVFVSDMPWARSTCGWNSMLGGGASEAVRDNAPPGGGFSLAGFPYPKAVWTSAYDDSRPADVVLDISQQRFSRFKGHVGVGKARGTVQFQVLVDGKVRYESPVMAFRELRSICLDVAGAKEVILRVLNGGDRGSYDCAMWGFAHFVEAGAEDPLEEPPAELRSATDANAALFLATIHWRVDNKDLARRWFDKAAAWMDKNKTEAEILQRYRAEAAQLLGIPDKAPAATPAARGGKSSIRWLGYTVRNHPTKSVAEIADYTNIVFDHGWPNYGDELIKAARKAGLKVVLVFYDKAEQELFLKQGIVLARNNRDVVQAVCWSDPYGTGFQAGDLITFRRTLEERVPGVQFWATFWASFWADASAKARLSPVPPCVDVLLIDLSGLNLPHHVRRTARTAFPLWREKASGRPVLLYWNTWLYRPQSLVYFTDPGTMYACAQCAEEHGLAGLIFDDYGTETEDRRQRTNPDAWVVGLQTRPELVAEIKRIARDVGIGKPSFVSGEPAGLDHKLGPLDLAIADYSEVIRLNPKAADAYLRRGAVHATKGDLHAALLDFRQAVRLKADTPPSWSRWVCWWLPTMIRPADKLPGVVFVSDMPSVGSSDGVRRYNPPGEGMAIDGLPYSRGILNNGFDGRPRDVLVDVSGQKFTHFKAHVGLAANTGHTAQFQVLVDGKLKHETPGIRRDELHSISVDVTRAKEVVLRLVNSGGGWGFARFVQAGAEDPLEEPPPELRSATDANAALLLAEVWWRLNEKDLARRWFDKAAAWMDKNKTEAEKLRPFRAEAAELLGIDKKPQAAKDKKRAP